MSEIPLKDEALVLGWVPITNSSRVLQVFSRDHGRLGLMLKGGLRPKSWMLGQYDLFQNIEILFVPQRGEGLAMLRECSPIVLRSGLRRAWRSCAVASYLADLLNRVLPDHVPEPDLYECMQEVMDLLDLQEPSPLLPAWCELQVLKALGLEPSLQGEGRLFHYAEGRLVDGEIRERAAEVSGGVLALLRQLQELDSPETLQRIRVLPGQFQELYSHVDEFSTWHLDQPLPSRDLALDLLLRQRHSA